MALADFQALIAGLIRDDEAAITTAQRDQAISLGLDRYSQDRPRLKVEDANAAGGEILTLPGSYESDFSRLTAIEYPVGDVPPSMVDGETWRVLATPSGDRLLWDGAPASGQTYRLRYTIRHLLDGANDTIPRNDREAVAKWAAALLLEQLAARAAGTTDSTIAADGVERADQARKYADRAAALRRDYFDQLGIDPKRALGAGAVVVLKPTDSLGGARLTHGQAF